MAHSIKLFMKQKMPWLTSAQKKIRMAKSQFVYSSRIAYYHFRHPNQSVFQKVFDNNDWGSESVSGAGSVLSQTANLRELLPVLIKELNVKSMLDAPCGDYHWMSETQLGVDSYIGVDIVPTLIRQNSERYSSNTVNFLLRDITKDELPQVDIILCRDCFVHLSFGSIAKAMNNFRKSGSTYLLTTTYPKLLRRNRNILDGMWRPIDLELPPFSLGAPIQSFNEKTTETSDYPEKSLGLWKL